MAAFVQKQLEKILARKELKWKNNEKLRQECEKALHAVNNVAKHVVDDNEAFSILPQSRLQANRFSAENLTKNDKSKTGSKEKLAVEGDLALVDGATPEASNPVPPELYLMALLECCKSNIPQVQTLALDSIQKLMIFGHIVCEENPSGLRRAELIVSYVCDSFKGTGSDEQVSLQLLKVLLTSVQANNFAVHGQTLLLAIKTAYNIALASKSMVNQATARATLTQTVNFLFAKMETEAIENDFVPVDELKRVASRESNRSELNIHSDKSNDDSSNSKEEEKNSEERKSEKTAEQTELDESAVADQESDQKTDMSSQEVAESIFKNIMTQVLDKIDPPPKFPDKNGFQSECQKDCFIVLRSLCKLSQKAIDGAEASSGPNSTVDLKSHELRSKVLSLQLIKSALQQAGPVFKTHTAFLRAVQEFLCIAMSRNGLSPVQEVFELSVAIILHLIHDFRFHLRFGVMC